MDETGLQLRVIRLSVDQKRVILERKYFKLKIMSVLSLLLQ
jgi:hypothetical protein